MTKNIQKPPINKLTKRKPQPKKPAKPQLSEKTVIFGSALVVLIIMVSIHLSGCFNEVKANKYEMSYVTVPEFGIKMPTSFGIHGIDVSVHQGKLNWKKIKSVGDDIRIDFAFIKATEGRTRVDRYFKNNWKEAKNKEIIRGAYHFFLPNKSGKDQAKLFLKTVTFEEGDLVPVCDIEITGGADKNTIHQNLQEWLDAVEDKVGKKPILYSSKRFYETYLAGHFDDYPLWIAHYHVPYLELGGKNDWHFWQHTDQGKIQGIPKNLDFNVFNGTLEDLNDFRI